MTLTESPPAPLPTTAPPAQSPGLLRDYIELAKARLNAMVLVTTAAGYVVVGGWTIDWARFLLTLLGTGLAAAGASALNQLLERDRDAAMLRTRNRPLPSGRVSRLHALAFGVATTAAGLGILNELVHPLAAALGLANVVIYVAVYTPLKPRSSLSTLVGAVCGALPPMMGAAAVAGSVPLAGWLLGLILFLWQIPHFLALAWMYREDFARAGFRMLPQGDPQGQLTCLVMLLYALAMMPIAILPTLFGVAGYLYGIASLGLGLWLFWLVVRLQAARTAANARRVFLASIVYLPLLLAALVLDLHGPMALPGLSM